MPQSVGMIGGKPSQALYFIGHVGALSIQENYKFSFVNVYMILLRRGGSFSGPTCYSKCH